MATIGALNVLLRLRSEGFASGLEAAGRRAEHLSRQLDRVGRQMTRQLTAPILAAATAAGTLAIRSGNLADELLDLSDITGLTTDQLQEFRRVTTAAGVSSDALESAAGSLLRRMDGIAQGTGTASRILESMGVSALTAEGNMRGMDELLPEIISGLAEMTNETERNAAATQLLGRSALSLAPVLGMGADEIERLRQESRDLGEVIDRETLEASNRFRQEWDLMRRELGLAATELGTALIPLMRDFTDLMTDDVVPAVRAAVDWFDSLEHETQRAGVQVAAFVAAAGPLVLILSRVVRIGGGVLTLLAGITTVAGGLKVALAALGIGAVVVGFNNLRNAGREAREELEAIERFAGQVNETLTELSANELLARGDFFAGALHEARGQVIALREEIATLEGTPGVFAGTEDVIRLRELREELEDAERHQAKMAAALEQVQSNYDATAEAARAAADAEGDRADDAAAAAQRVSEEDLDRLSLLVTASELRALEASELSELFRLQSRVTQAISDGEPDLARRLELVRAERDALAEIEGRFLPEIRDITFDTATGMGLLPIEAERLEVAMEGAGREIRDVGEESVSTVDRVLDHLEENWQVVASQIGAGLGGIASQVANIATSFAAGGPAGGIGAAISFVVGSITGGRRAERIEEAGRRFDRALDGLTDILTDETRFERLRGSAEDMAREALTAMVATIAGQTPWTRDIIESQLGGLDELMALPVEEALERVAELQERLTGSLPAELAEDAQRALEEYGAALERIKDAEEARAENIRDNFEVEFLRIQGLDDEADALARTLRFEQARKEALELGDESLAEFIDKVKEAADAAAEAAAREDEKRAKEEAAAERREFMSELASRQAHAFGSELEALAHDLEASAKQELERARALYEAGRISEDALREFADVLDAELETALREAEEAARRQAEAERERLRSMEANARIRLLEAQGMEEAAQALRDQEEVNRLIAQGASSATIEMIRQAQALDAQKRAASESADETERAAAAMRGMTRALNAPQGFRLSLAEFRATAAPTPGTGGATPVMEGQSVSYTIEGGIQISTTGRESPKEVAEKVLKGFDDLERSGVDTRTRVGRR